MEDKNYTLDELKQKLINYIVSQIDNEAFIDEDDIEIIKILFNAEH